MSNEFDKYKIELESFGSNSNNLGLKPDDMKEWLRKTPQGVKNFLGENIFPTLMSHTQSVSSHFCERKSDMNPANYSAKMISNLLKDYINPDKKDDMQKAGINKEYIKELMECVNDSRLSSVKVIHEKIAGELTEAMSAVNKSWEQEKQQDINLIKASYISEELYGIRETIQSGDSRKNTLENRQAKLLSELDQIGISPIQAKDALDERKIDEANKLRVADKDGIEKRTAAVQRGSVITTYDPTDKDMGGYYRNVRHYRTEDNGSLTPISRDAASQIISNGWKSAERDTEIAKGEKLNINYIMNNKINYRRD